MIDRSDLASRFALDVQAVGSLKSGAGQNSPESLKKVAQQFEALLMNMMLKSMREATPQDDVFGSDQTRLYTSMLDQQLSQTLSSRGIGLADAMVRQLSGHLGNAAQTGVASLMQDAGIERTNISVPGLSGDASSAVSTAEGVKNDKAFAGPREFVQAMMPHAQRASETTGIPASFMIAQAALETGWGKRDIRGADGQPSYNLFGIKAGANWSGKTVDITTTEYVNGHPVKMVDRFRAYDSHADSFADYARLLQSNPRYQQVLNDAQDAAGFAGGLQRAGYATDPAYAQKLLALIRQIGPQIG
ncbi:MAG: flagellar assembly peptidoglycan hydrolase FlgJ [Hydrogenophilaceae bacterium]|nr:flagellar assembly peptidoglycan hydrolase FlgJ [Hydrogenophilaceae bacterium]